MDRYEMRRPVRADWCEQDIVDVVQPRLEVVDAPDGIDTGLLDRNGHRIYRYSKTRMGYL
jgi:hypothetical protein